VTESAFLAGRLERDVVLDSLVRHSVPGVERVNLGNGTVTRLISGACAACPVPVTVAVRDDGVEVHGCVSPDVLAAVREWFDLDADVDAVADAFGDDPLLGPLVGDRPALRVIGHPDAFEAAAQTVLGQQVSLAACRTFTGRLAAAYGTRRELAVGADGDPDDDALIAFPSAEVVASAELEELRAAVGIPVARARTVIAVAEAFASGLRVARDADHMDVRADLLALPGIGPWTVDYLALRVLRDPDAFPVGDLVLRRALGGVSPAEALGLGERWRPWRAYATMHLWAADAIGSTAALPRGL